ncbi:MAG: hypothetical protein AAF560_23585 [Acidobacteriota bacterium]
MIQETNGVCIGYDDDNQLVLLEAPDSSAPMVPPRFTVPFGATVHFRFYVKTGLAVTFANPAITWYDPATKLSLSPPSNVASLHVDAARKTLSFDYQSSSVSTSTEHHFWLDMLDGATPIRIGGPTPSDPSVRFADPVDPTIVDVGDQ